MPIATVDSSGARLSVLDADPARRRALCALLDDAGYATAVGLEGPSADPSVGSFDLCILDLDATAPQAIDEFLSLWPETPIIGVTADTSPHGRRHAAETGVTDFLVRPVEAAELRLRVQNALGAGRLRRMLADRSTRLTEALRDHTAEVGVVRESLSLLAAIADFHDDDTDQHAHRVGQLAVSIAHALGCPESYAEMLGDAAPLHDLGKVGISRRILLKPGSLSPPERMHMMQHVEIGSQILATARSPVLVLAAEIARTHHERWDGSGYTDGLIGKQIPLCGRIVAVCDVWDTLTHDRPYRKAWEPERALAEIHEQTGAHFDPRVVEAFSSLDLIPVVAAPGTLTI